MSEILFWLGWLKIPSNYDVSWILQENIIAKISTIDTLSELTLAVYYYHNQAYYDFILKNTTEIETLFQIQTNTLWIENKPSNPIAHYIVSNKKDNTDFSKDLNEQTCFRAKILRKLFPDAENFGAKGYGHHVPFMELPFDETNKPSILKSAFPIKKLVTINATYANLADYIHRPDNWKIYAEKIIADRKQFVDGLTCLNQALIAHFRSDKPQSVMGWKIDGDYWEKLSKINMLSSMFPKVAVDPWGYISEGTNNDSKEKESKQPNPINMSVILEQYKDYKKSWGNYLHSIINFIGQADLILSVNGFIGRLPQSQHEAFFKKSEELGRPYTAHTVHLTVINLNDTKCNLVKFQLEFRDKFKEIIDLNALKKLEEQEISKIEKSWNIAFSSLTDIKIIYIFKISIYIF